jgi:hypothetical protein
MSRKRTRRSPKARDSLTNPQILLATIAIIGALTMVAVTASIFLFPSYYDRPEKIIILVVIALAGVVSVIGGLKNATELFGNLIGTQGKIPTRAKRPFVQQPAQTSQQISDLQSATLPLLQSAEYAMLKVVSDSLGNVNLNSWAKGTGGNWSHPKNTNLRVGDQIKLSVTAEYRGLGALQYRFSLQRPGRSFEIRQDWSLIKSTWTWNVTKEDIGKGIVIMVAVRAARDYYRLNDSDDYTYALYDVLPTAKGE